MFQGQLHGCFSIPGLCTRNLALIRPAAQNAVCDYKLLYALPQYFSVLTTVRQPQEKLLPP